MSNYTIDIQNLFYSIPYGESILEGVTLQTLPGEFYGILGRNGSGKTTLIDLIIGGRNVTSGKLLVLSEDPISIERQYTENVSFISQDVSLKGNISIAQFLKFHAGFYPKYSKEVESQLLPYFSLDPETKIGALSTGQQKKVQIVAGFASMPKIIIIDEITAVLDPETRALFFEFLMSFKNQHKVTILLATNIAEDLIGKVDKVLFINNKHGTIHDPSDIKKLFNLIDQK